jgi:hypothetical protein
VARQQGYHGEPFQTERGTTQGDIMSPTIFNVVADAIVREWYHRLETGGIPPDTVRAIFYADDGHLYSNNADALQQATNIMVDFFKTVGLKINPGKTKSMVCTPKPSVTRICSPAYKRRMIDRNEPTYSARKRQQIECDICNAKIQAKSLTRHKRLKHGIDTTITTQQNTPPHLAMLPGNTYEVSMPTYKDPTPCPVPGCGVTIQNRYKMREHFLYCHYYDTIIISEEGLLPRCDKCGLFCSEAALATTHRDSAACRRNEKRNRKKKLNLQCIRAHRQTFQVQDQPIKAVTNFRYLGRIITSNDNDWLAAHRNLHKARQRWAQIARILTRESATPRISALFYKATIQTVLLYGSKTWVISNEILQMLTSFHHAIARRLTGRHPRPIPNTDEWEYPDTEETLRIAGLFPMTEYLKRRRTYLEQYARYLPILQECRDTLLIERPSRRVFWWNQPLANAMLLTEQDPTTTNQDDNDA